MTVEDKQKYKEYQKNYREAKKQQCNYIDIFIKKVFLYCIFLNTLLSSNLIHTTGFY